MYRTALICSFAFAAAFAQAEDWTEFRGPGRQGHSSATGLPVSWSNEENVVWRQEIPGNGWSSPVVSDGRIYLTAAIPATAEDDEKPGYSLVALILDAATGKLQRQVEIFEQDGMKAPRIHRKNSHASPTPIIAQGRVFVHFGHQGAACLDLEGNIVWRNDEVQYPPVHGNGGSPVLVGDSLIYSCDGARDPFVVALHRETGKVRWRTGRETDASRKFSFSTPQLITVAGQPQIISPGSNCVCAFNPETGEEIWRVNYDGYSVIPRPVFGHGLLFVCTGYNTPGLLAIRPDGQGDVTDTHVVWERKKAIPHTPSLLLIDDLLYMVSDRGIASCLEAASGEPVWTERVSGSWSASPLYGDGKIYLQSEDGEGIVIKPGRTFERLATNTLGERTLASYGVDGNALLIRSAQHLYRIASPPSR